MLREDLGEREPPGKKPRQTVGAENSIQLTASKKAGISVLHPQGTEFCPQPPGPAREPGLQKETKPKKTFIAAS